MLQMWIITLQCGHTRQLHWVPKHGFYWCLQCTDMGQVLDSESTNIATDIDAVESDLVEVDDTVWIREPTAAERRELERVQRLINKR